MDIIAIPGTNIKAVALDTLPPEAWTTVGHKNPAIDDVRPVYTNVGLVNRCVDIRANSLAKVPWQITRGETVVLETGMKVSAGMEWARRLTAMLKLTEASRTLVTEAFWFIERNRAKPLDLRWWSPLVTAPIWDESLGLTHFERTVNGKKMRFELDDVCYIWEVHPLHETQPAPSPVQAALASANVVLNADILAANYFERGAIKATLLAVSGNPAPAEKERLKAWWKRAVSGVKNAFAGEVINADAITPITIGEGLSELNNAELNADKRMDIAATLGVPLSMVLANAANYATAQQDERNFYNATIIPECEIIAETLNEQLFDRYGLHFEFLPYTLDVFQVDEQERAQSYSTYVNAGMKASIAAEMLGLELPQGIEYADLDPDEPEPQPETPPLGSESPDAMDDAQEDDEESEDRKADQAKAIEAGKFRKWLKRNSGRLERWQDFDSTILTNAEKAAIVDEVAGDGDAEDTPFVVTLPESGRLTPEWVKALILQLDDDDDEAEQAARMAIERRTVRQMSESLEDWLQSVVSGLTDAEVQMLARMLRDGSMRYRDVLQRALVDSADLGVSVAVAQMEGIGYGFDYTLANAAARDWARQYTDVVLEQLYTTNDRIVGEAVARWVDNGEPLESLVDDLRPHFGRQRAQRIAATEVTRAYAEANTVAYRESGVVGRVEWRTANDERVCPVCGPLHGQQTELGQRFGESQLYPPAHPNCRCWVVPVIQEPDDGE